MSNLDDGHALVAVDKHRGVDLVSTKVEVVLVAGVQIALDADGLQRGVASVIAPLDELHHASIGKQVLD